MTKAPKEKQKSKIEVSENMKFKTFFWVGSLPFWSKDYVNNGGGQNNKIVIQWFRKSRTCTNQLSLHFQN